MATTKKQIKIPSQESRDSKPLDGEVPELKIRPKRLTKKGRLEAVLVEVFHEHWQLVAMKINAGKNIAKTRSRFVFACNNRQRERYAGQYYAPARALKLASAPADEVLRLTSTWFEDFCDHADVWLTEPSEIRRELCQLVAAEYVAVTLSDRGSGALGIGHGAGVHPLPNESVVYGDIYEITASGLSIGASLRICKSVAEPFSESERSDAMVGIKREFFQNARADGEGRNEWWIESMDEIPDPIDPRVIDVRVGFRW